MTANSGAVVKPECRPRRGGPGPSAIDKARQAQLTCGSRQSHVPERCRPYRGGTSWSRLRSRGAGMSGVLPRKGAHEAEGPDRPGDRGSRGIGRAIAQALAAEGAAVAVNYRSGKEEAEEVVQEIKAAGGRAVALPGDVSDYDQAETLVEQTVEQLGGLHVLVNNAGIAKDALIFNMEPEDWLDVMRVNFGGVFNCTKAAMGHFMGQRDGVIVNVSSVMGERGWIGESNYAASKGAVNAFTRCCAMELARFGVRVNAVLPGFAPTELVAGLIEKDGGKGIKKQIPMRDFGTVEEVARVVAVPGRPRLELHDRVLSRSTAARAPCSASGRRCSELLAGMVTNVPDRIDRPDG